jgi:predicted AlkP superfamily phosphohydrolase/phosphomutase
VIGLDGATFDVLDPLFEQGLLPHLAALRQRGTEGVLETILPPVSPPAWTSATTGVNPGKHNIYDFFHFSSAQPGALLTSSLDRRARPVWQFLNEAGYRTVIMNVPMTFPPDRVKGLFISGFPYGKATTGYTYPPDLEKRIAPYPLDPFGESIQPGLEGRLLHAFQSIFERHSQVAEELLREEDWDLFWVVFTGTDKVQHFYWKFSDPDHPDYDPMLAARFGEAIRDFFVRVDEVIGEMVEIAGPETDVFVVSDHGFGPIYRELRLLRWLRREGFLAPDPAGGDYPHVEAFPPGPFGGLLRVNVRGRDYRGTVEPGEPARRVREELRRRLTALRDPVSGEPFVEEIFYREEIYEGPYVDNAPDIVFLEAPREFVGRGDPNEGEVFGPPSYTFSGFHRPEGVWIAAGPHIPANPRRQRFSILEVAPAIYWLFDLEMPADLEGRGPAARGGAEALRARPRGSGSARR